MLLFYLDEYYKLWITLSVRVASDDITLTVDGKDTYDEVKKSGRYRWGPHWQSGQPAVCVASTHTVCILVVPESVRGRREFQPQTSWAGCCSWPKHTTATLWASPNSLLKCSLERINPVFSSFISQDSSDYQQHKDNFGKVKLYLNHIKSIWNK